MTNYSGITAGDPAQFWNDWNSSAAIMSTGAVWHQWNTLSAGATSTDTIWVGWNGAAGLTYYVRANSYAPISETKEQKAEREERQRKAELEVKELERKRLKAEKAALKLFVGLVGRASYKLFKKRMYHEVIGHSGKRYRMRAGCRVEEMVGHFGDQVAAYLCIHSDHSYELPQMDTLVQQMLLIMSGEEGEALLTRTANKTAVAA